MSSFGSMIKPDGGNKPPGTLSWSKADYETAVNIVLGNIRKRKTGQVLLDFPGGGIVHIIPGTVETTRTTPVKPQDAFPKFRRERICKADDSHAGEIKPDAKFGTGLGSEVNIEYTPKDWVGRTAPGSMQDEVLLHELVHAFRMSTGTQRCRPWGGHMDTEEEVIAIAVANMYASEQGRLLRKNGKDFPVMEDPEKWMEDNYLPLRWFKREKLGKALADVKAATFNPFARRG